MSQLGDLLSIPFQPSLGVRRMSIGETNAEGTKPRTIGSYRIIQQLGSGGMSTVFRCVHVQTGSVVAVKILPRTLAKNSTLLQRFINEAKNAEKLQHPNIVAIYDRGFDQGRHYLVLEFVEGGDLQERVRNEGPLSIEEAVLVIREVAEGLRYAARQGVIHRDIKPANLLLSPTGHVKIIDLGLAVETDPEDERVTRDGTTVGTVDYMAPEQAHNSRSTSEASDIYSLGCTLFYLLTGAPPYAGGNVLEKLSRHCKGVIPDIRAKRPEAPENLALLVKRMMAKQPLQRFASHAELLVAINALGIATPANPGATPLTALIVDDEEGDNQDAPLVMLPSLPERHSLPAPASSTRLPSSKSQPALDLADLVGIDEDDEHAPRRRRPAGTGSPSGVLMAQIVEEVDDEFYESPPSSVRRALGSGFLENTTSLKTFIGIGVAIGLSIALVGYGAIQLFISATNAETSEALAGIQGGPPVEKFPTINKPALVPDGKTSADPPAVVSPPKSDVPVVWVEPADVARPLRGRTPLPIAVQVKFLPDWAHSSNPPEAEAPSTLVKRFDDARPGPDGSPLRSAMLKADTTVEIADVGPFFEGEWKVPGRSRVIKAAPGYRPMLVIQGPSGGNGGEHPAPIVLEGTRLTLEGIDLVVDLKNMPARQQSLFYCLGGSLRFVDSTITVLNGEGRSFSIARFEPTTAGSPGPSGSRLSLERSFVRGSLGRLAEVGPLPFDLVVIHSAVVGDAGPLISLRPSASKVTRRVFLAESLFATSGSIVECPGKAESALVLRAYRTILARLDSVSQTGMIAVKSDRPAGGLAGIDWIAEECRFAGWPSLVSSGNDPRVHIKDLDAVKKFDPKALITCEFDKTPWPSSLTNEELSPADFVERIGSVGRAPGGLLAEIAPPTPMIRLKTVEAFIPSPVPELIAIPATPVKVTAEVQSTRWVELSFALDSLDEDKGDLGRFLARQKFKADDRVRVRLTGRGSHLMTPVQLNEPISLEILPAEHHGGTDGIVLAPTAGAAADALISLKGGSLRLRDLSLEKTEGRRLASLLSVESGHLVLEACRLVSGDKNDVGRGTLIAFKSPGTRPRRAKEPSPFASAVALPYFLAVNSVFLANHDAISADLGAGRVVLSNCLVWSDRGACFAFRPGACSRSRFDVQTQIERCTIAGRKTAFRVGPWPSGGETGPDRPWLIWAHQSLFNDPSPASKREMVLIRAGAETLAHNLIFWQGDSNCFDMPGFRATSDLAAPSARDRADLKRLWVDYWGPAHVVNSAGPTAKGTEGAVFPVLKFANPGPETDAVRLPANLALDAKAHPALGADFRNLPLLASDSARR